MRQIQFNEIGNYDILRDCIIGDHIEFEIICDHITSGLIYLDIHNLNPPPTLEAINYDRPLNKLKRILSIESKVIDSIENKILKFDGGTIRYEFTISNDDVYNMKLFIKINLKELKKY